MTKRLETALIIAVLIACAAFTIWCTWSTFITPTPVDNSTPTLTQSHLENLTGQHFTGPADVTYAPCSWFTTGHSIPAYTHTDSCIAADGSIQAVK
jgi:hypothetical protein